MGIHEVNEIMVFENTVEDFVKAYVEKTYNLSKNYWHGGYNIPEPDVKSIKLKIKFLNKEIERIKNTPKEDIYKDEMELNKELVLKKKAEITEIHRNRMRYSSKLEQLKRWKPEKEFMKLKESLVESFKYVLKRNLSDERIKELQVDIQHLIKPFSDEEKEELKDIMLKDFIRKKRNLEKELKTIINKTEKKKRWVSGFRKELSKLNEIWNENRINGGEL